MEDVELALDAAKQAFAELQKLPREVIAGFLNAYADAIEARADRIVEAAVAETACPPNHA